MEPEIEDLSYPLVLDGREHRVDTRYAHDLKVPTRLYAIFTGAANANRYIAFMAQHPNVIAEVYREDSPESGCQRYYVVQHVGYSRPLDVVIDHPLFLGRDPFQVQYLSYSSLLDVTDAVVRLKKLYALLG